MPAPRDDGVRDVLARSRRRLIAAWQAWAPDAPDALAASLLITAPPVTGEGVRRATRGPEAELRALLEPLGEPLSAPRPDGLHARGQALPRRPRRRGRGRGLGHAYLRSEYFAEPLPADAIAALVAHARRGDDFDRELDFSPWGGAYCRTPVEATAFAHRDARFLLKHAAVVEPGGPVEAAREWLDRAHAITHPYGTGGVYPNFPEDDLDRWAVEYLGANRERLLELKRRYDPEEVLS